MSLIKCVLALLFLGAINMPQAAAAQTNSRSVRLPDFAGRDKQFAYMRTRILAGLQEGANFAEHYTIVVTGCGSGCTSNLMVDRRTGKVSRVPYGGEMQQMLTLRHRVNSNILVATWFDGGLCVMQQARWNGTEFVIVASPKGQPDAACAE